MSLPQLPYLSRIASESPQEAMPVYNALDPHTMSLLTGEYLPYGYTSPIIGDTALAPGGDTKDAAAPSVKCGPGTLFPVCPPGMTSTSPTGSFTGEGGGTCGNLTPCSPLDIACIVNNTISELNCEIQLTAVRVAIFIIAAVVGFIALTAFLKDTGLPTPKVPNVMSIMRKAGSKS